MKLKITYSAVVDIDPTHFVDDGDKTPTPEQLILIIEDNLPNYVDSVIGSIGLEAKVAEATEEEIAEYDKKVAELVDRRNQETARREKNERNIGLKSGDVGYVE